MAMATTTVGRLPFHIATSAMAMRMAGMAMTPSIVRISGPSSQRRKPATRPRAMPKASATTAVHRPTMSETWVP